MLSVLFELNKAAGRIVSPGVSLSLSNLRLCVAAQVHVGCSLLRAARVHWKVVSHIDLLKAALASLAPKRYQSLRNLEVDLIVNSDLTQGLPFGLPSALAQLLLAPVSLIVQECKARGPGAVFLSHGC